MKKNYVLICIMFYTSLGIAQQQSPDMVVETIKAIHAQHIVPSNTPVSTSSSSAPFWTNNFSNPSDWVLDNDGQNPPNYGWSIDANVDGWFFTTSGGPQAPASGAFAECNNGNPTVGAGTQALGVTYTMTTANPIDVNSYIGSANATLSFQDKGARFYDLGEVQVSTDGVTFVTVEDNMHYPMLAQSGGTWHDEVRTMNIQPYIAANPSSVWIRFSWTTAVPSQSTNANVWITYGWMIDDVALTETPAHDVDIDGYNFGGWLTNNPTTTGDMGIPYTFNPISQLANNPYTMEADVINKGASVQNNCKLHVAVEESGMGLVHFDSSAATTLQPGDTTLYSISNSYTPSNSGQYWFNFWGNSDSTSTDTVVRGSIVTDTIYGRDKDWNNSGSNIGNGLYLGRSCGANILANAFEIYASTTVTSISFFVNDESVAGAVLNVELYEYDPTATSISSSPPMLLSESDPYALQPQDIANWKTLSLLTSIPVFPGTGNVAYLAAVKGTQLPA